MNIEAAPAAPNPAFLAATLAPLNVASAIALLDSWPDLSTSRRRDLASCLSTVARVAGLPHDSMMLSPAELRIHYFNKLKVGADLSSRRISNVTSGLRFALRHLGVIDADESEASSCWADLLARLNVRRRAALIKFARFCTTQNIEPPGVSDESLAAFEHWLTERTVAARPRKSASLVRGAWNRAGAADTAWPGFRFALLREAGQYILPLSAFQRSFTVDLTAYTKRLCSTPLDDPFEQDLSECDTLAAPSRALRPKTAALRKDHLRWAASALVATGVPAQDIASLADLVTPVGRVKVILRFLYNRNNAKPSAGAMHIANALRMLAKNHVRLRDEELRQIGDWSKPVQLEYNGMTPKNEVVIGRLKDPVAEQKLLLLPATLMKAARQLRQVSPERAASLALRAVAVDFLTHLPLRLSNVVGLRLDTHLQRANPPRGRITAVRIPELEVKNGQAIQLPVPDQTARLIDEWVRDFRPLVSPQPGMHLFPGKSAKGGHITPVGMRAAIKDATRSLVGVQITPHQFRHLAARLLLDHHPGCYELVRRLLGHKSLTATVKSYCSIECGAAAEQLDAVIQTRRNLSRPPKRQTAAKPARKHGRGPLR